MNVRSFFAMFALLCNVYVLINIKPEMLVNPANFVPIVALVFLMIVASLVIIIVEIEKK